MTALYAPTLLAFQLRCPGLHFCSAFFLSPFICSRSIIQSSFIQLGHLTSDRKKRVRTVFAIHLLASLTFQLERVLFFVGERWEFKTWMRANSLVNNNRSGWRRVWMSFITLLCFSLLMCSGCSYHSWQRSLIISKQICPDFGHQ